MVFDEMWKPFNPNPSSPPSVLFLYRTQVNVWVSDEMGKPRLLPGYARSVCGILGLILVLCKLENRLVFSELEKPMRSVMIGLD